VRHRLLIIVGAIVVVVLVILLVGVTVDNWGRPAPSALPTPLPTLAITFDANTSAEVTTLLTTIRPYVLPGDSFDLVSGSPESSPLSVTNVNHWAAELRETFPSATIYAHTAGISNYGTLSAGVRGNVTGVLYDYEPTFEPEFTYNFSSTLSNFQNVSAAARAAGVESVGYPIGRPILGAEVEDYRWNYAVLAGAVDRLVIQTQYYCKVGPTTFATAVSTVLDQYAAADVSPAPTFQVTIGNATTSLPNGVTAAPAYDCAQELTSLGLHTLYVWWDEGAASELVQFLQDIGRT
jgi:hypothetical protein